jgi:16S rRNA processing protein RimM
MTDKHSAKGLVPMGGVVKPHGISGELCIKSNADSPSIFGRVPALFLQKGITPPESYTVRSCREHKGFVLLQLHGVDDRNRAEELRGFTVLVREADLPELDEGENYLYEMMGCRVVLEDGSEIGVLDNFFENAGQDVWSILDEQGREILLPAVPEFVLDVDLDAEVIVVNPPEGLVDIYLAPRTTKKKNKRPSRRNKPQPKQS